MMHEEYSVLPQRDSFTLSASTVPYPVRPILLERARVIYEAVLHLVWFLLCYSGRVCYRQVVNVNGSLK